MTYVNYKRFSVEYDQSCNAFVCTDAASGRFLSGGHIAKIMSGDRVACISDYSKVVTSADSLPDGRKLTVRYEDGPDWQPVLGMELRIDKDGITLTALYAVHDTDVLIEGDLHWGEDPESSTYAVRLDGGGHALRAAHGPAASKSDNALYDRRRDSVLHLTGSGSIRLAFDWEKGCYTFSSLLYGSTKRLRLVVRDSYYATRFSVPHRPINKSHQFPTPPVGWMTWYSVQFGASEKTVLENARWLAAHLKDYGATCIWVDWEWYHSNFVGQESPGIDIFNPNRERYPNGLKHVSDEIRKLGLIPALWIAATDDTNKNRMMQEHEDWILVELPRWWCGRWFVDPTHPGVLGEYIPAVFRQLLDWGFEVFKWDDLPGALNTYDRHQDRFYNRDISSEQALREVVRIARGIIGENRYMMSCSGETTRAITFAADYFDGARIGGDIFNWGEFVSECIDKVLKYYVYHNVLWYADADNLVVRSEHNNMEQARTRASFYGLLGLPITLGDNLPDLEEDRVELLKRALPAIDVHPMEIRQMVRDTPYVVINLSVAKAFDSWNVIDVLNTTDATIDVRLRLSEDLDIDTSCAKAYIMYDYWEQTCLGVCRDSLDLTLPAYGSKVIRISEVREHPQVISTSRHVSQGAYDIDSLEWDDAECRLSGTSKVIGGEAYRIVLHVPAKYELVGAVTHSGASTAIIDQDSGVWVVEVVPDRTGTEDWDINFEKQDR